MKRLGKELKFISWIGREGEGTKPVTKEHIELMQDNSFRINCLSLTYKTYIASGFNSFVVKLKNEQLTK